MNYADLQPVVVLLIVVLLVLGARKPSRFGRLGDELSYLLRELKRRIVVLLIRGVHELSRLGGPGVDLSHVLHELQRHVPVYSAETVQGKEAEFIRDDLPKRFPTALVVIGLFALVVVASWLSR